MSTSRFRWPPLGGETARDFFDRAMTSLKHDVESDRDDHARLGLSGPNDGLISHYLDRAARLGQDLAEDLQTERDATTIDGWASPIAPWHPSQPIPPEPTPTPAPTTPYFTHDCQACVYLGSARVDGQRVDFYRHPGATPLAGATALARTGHDGPAYSSMPEDMLAVFQVVGPLTEYRRRYLTPAS